MAKKQPYCTTCGLYCVVSSNGKSKCCNAPVGKKE